MKPFILYLILVITTLHTAGADETTVAQYAERFYKEWGAQTTLQDMGGPFNSISFYRDVPASMRPQVLDQILGRDLHPETSHVDSWATYTALQCVGDLTRFSPGAPLPGNLHADIVKLSKSLSYGIREQVIDILGGLGRKEDHDLLVSALNDPKDEVRDYAITAIRRQPDAATIFRKYIAEHRSNPDYKSSVLSAEAGLEALKEKSESDHKL